MSNPTGYAGTTETNQNEFHYYTGLESFQFVGVNPTRAQLEEWQGRELSFDPTYDVAQNQIGQTVRPFHIWLRGETAGLQRLILNIGNESNITQGGNYQVITSNGSVVWAKASGSTEVKPEFVDHQPLKIGEADLIDFIQKLTGFSTKSGADFYLQMQQFKQDAQSIYEGNYSGFKTLADWTADRWITLPLAVKESEVVDANGNNKTKLKQIIPYRTGNLNNILFRDKLSDWSKGKFTERATKDQDLIKNCLYTIDFMIFDKSKCFGNVPTNPVTSTNTWNA